MSISPTVAPRSQRSASTNGRAATRIAPHRGRYARGDSYVVEADDRIVATAMIGFSASATTIASEEGSWPLPHVRASVLRRGAPVAVASDGRIAARDVSAGSRRRAGARERKRQRPHRHAPRQRAYEKAAGESRHMSSAASSTSPMPKRGRLSASLERLV
ncbi:MAG: hypothetical protein ACLTMP_09765 [Eggerthella lenta]